MSDPMTPEVREWMKRSDAQPPDAQQAARQVMSRLPEVRQRRRWWPFPAFYRQPQQPTATDSSEYQPAPIPATNGHTPTVIGRTQTMFSPAKAITAGALVFAIGGVMFVAQPFDQQGSVPGAAIDAEPTWVTGTITLAATCTGPTMATPAPEGVRHERDYICQPQTWTTSDPRLSGTAAATWNADVYTLDEGVKSVITEAFYVSNEGGAWACRSNGLQHGTGLLQPWENEETLMCVGEGGYVGLSAILVLGNPEGPDLVGMIFPGDAPPLPERPASE